MFSNIQFLSKSKSNNPFQLSRQQIPSGYNIQNKLRADKRNKQIQIMKTQRINSFLKQNQDSISNFYIIKPLKKFSSLNENQIQNAFKVLKTQIANKKLNERINDIQFEEVLYKILGQIENVEYKNTIIESLGELCFLHQEAARRLYEFYHIQLWVIDQLKKIMRSMESLQYLKTIMKFIKKFIGRKNIQKKLMGQLCSLQYFELAFNLFLNCWSNQLQCKQIQNQIIQQFVSTAALFLNHSQNITKFLQDQLLVFLFINNRDQKYLTQSLQLIMFVKSLIKSKIITPQQFEQHIQIQNVCSKIIQNAMNAKLNHRRSKWHELVSQQMYSSDFKINFLEMLILLYKWRIFNHYYYIDVKFILKHLRDSNETIKQLTIQLLSDVLSNISDLEPFNTIVKSDICILAMSKLSITNKNIQPYLNLAYCLSQSNVFKQTPDMLIDHKLFDRLAEILSDKQMSQNGEIMLVCLKILLEYLESSKKTKDERVKRIMDKMKIFSIVFRAQNNRMIEVRELAFRVLDEFENWGKRNRSMRN